MARQYGKAADYVGRQFDLLVLQGASPTNRDALHQTLFSEHDAGEVCTGVQMLAQRWVLHMLTIRGSIAYLENVGTLFMRDAQRGTWRTEADVAESFALAAVDAATAMRNEETEEMHPEDRFDSATLEEISLQPGQLVSLVVRITSLAGDARNIVLPIPFTPISVY